MIDSHCHPNCKELEDIAAEIMERAYSSGVESFMIVGCDLDDSLKALSMADKFKDFGAYAAVGIHPHEAQRYEINLNYYLDELEEMTQDARVLAWGEIGLDYYYDNSPRDTQRKIFIAQLDRALKLNLPVILHIRDAMSDALDILDDYKKNLKLLFHCYSGGLEHLERVLDMGGLCALGGAVTWKGKRSDELRQVAKLINIDRLLIETDCPYMTPAPFRGKLNEPSYIKYVYEAVAAVKDIEFNELEDKIKINFEKFFGINLSK